MICYRCNEKEAVACLTCVNELAGLEVLEQKNARLEKALEAVCAQIAVHKPHCPGKLYLSQWPECEKCPRDTVGADWKRWALEKAEQALEGSDR